MRTTLDISDDLLQQAKKLAVDGHISFKILVEDGLRHVILMRTKQKSTTSLTEIPIIDYARPVEGIDLNRTSELLDLE